MMSYAARCPATLSACTAAEIAQCDRWKNMTPATASAFAACVTDAPCVRNPLDDNGIGQCYFARVASVQPSGAQQKVATDFCASCGGPGASSCAASFFTDTTFGGFLVLEYSDGIAVEIDTTCLATPTVDAGRCSEVFGDCLSRVLHGHEPTAPTVCSGDAG
jgi:hypothetical protein